MKEKLIELLTKLKPGIDYQNQTNLISGGYFTSLEIMRLVMLLQDEFDVTISPLYIVPENFKSVDAMLHLIELVEDD